MKHIFFWSARLNLTVFLGNVVLSAAYGQALPPDVLVKAYPEQLASQDGVSILWRDGTKQPLTDGLAKTFDEKLKNASLLDQLSLQYPKGPPSHTPAPEEDPGRFRNSRFFDKMYGDCEKGEVQKQLVTILWVGGEKLRVTSINGVAERLRIIAEELSRLPDSLRRYTYPSAGTFMCRTVKDTGKRSMHAYGAAIDINTKYSDYWLWSKGPYRNRIPYEIVKMFEAQGFIWGGKWGHFDTMHFEYRPEFFIKRDHVGEENLPH
jgi:hypothetical protein